MSIDIRTVFHPAYAVEEVDLPGTGAFVNQYPARGQRVGSLILRFTTEMGSWIGDFRGGYRSAASFTGVVSTPNRSLAAILVAGNGVLVDTLSPERYEQLHVFPVTSVFEDPQGGLVLFADFSRVSAYGSDGRRWTSDLRADGIRAEGVGPDGIEVSVRRAPAFQHERLTLSRQDGSVVMPRV